MTIKRVVGVPLQVMGKCNANKEKCHACRQTKSKKGESKIRSKSKARQTTGNNVCIL